MHRFHGIDLASDGEQMPALDDLADALKSRILTASGALPSCTKCREMQNAATHVRSIAHAESMTDNCGQSCTGSLE